MDIPLQFHEFHHLNHVERCPKYSDILQKTEVVSPADLDSLYTDLEILEGASNIRLRRLEDEMKILTEWCDKKDRCKSDVDLEFLNNPSSNKRSRQGTVDDGSKVSKKQKFEDSFKAGSSKKKSKGKLSNEGTDADNNISKPRTTLDGPNKFWGFIEPYCADITPDDIVALEGMLTGKMEIAEFFKIPPLGKHYSEIWEKEDFIEEQQQAGKIEKKRSFPNNTTSSEQKLQKLDCSSVETEESCPYGTFTQRLVSALVDENIMAPMTGNEMQDVQSDKSRYHTEVKSFKKSTLSTKSLELAIKEELFSLGLIESCDDEELRFDADDEILSELQTCQSELRALRAHNKAAVDKVIEYSKVAIKKQDVKQKAKVVDAELVDIFRRFSSSKIKKKGISRKDRELAWKTLREREAIWKLVDCNDIKNVPEGTYAS